MTDFDNEGIYITPEGYFLSKWNSKKRTYEATTLDTSEIILRLNTQVFLTDGVRLKHVFTPLMDEELFAIIFHTDWWKELMNEIKSKQWPDWVGDKKLKKDIDGDELEYLELYKTINFSSEKKSMEYSTMWHFHGIGYPFITQQQAQSSYRQVGERQSYAIEFHSMSELMNLPLRVGTISLYNDDVEDYKKRQVLDFENGWLTLYELIHGIVWEMSFCGAGESKEDMKEELTSSVEEIEEIKNDPSAFVSFTATQTDDFFEQLTLQGQEEQANKVINKIATLFAEIENEELLAKMKSLLKEKINL